MHFRNIAQTINKHCVQKHKSNRFLELEYFISVFEDLCFKIISKMINLIIASILMNYECYSSHFLQLSGHSHRLKCGIDHSLSMDSIFSREISLQTGAIQRAKPHTPDWQYNSLHFVQPIPFRIFTELRWALFSPHQMCSYVINLIQINRFVRAELFLRTCIHDDLVNGYQAFFCLATHQRSCKNPYIYTERSWIRLWPLLGDSNLYCKFCLEVSWQKGGIIKLCPVQY